MYYLYYSTDFTCVYRLVPRGLIRSIFLHAAR